MRVLSVILLLLLLAPALRAGQGKVHYGKAAYYSKSLEGRRTASGEVYSPRKKTAAHPFLPLGTMVKVTNLGNGRSVVVRINDRMARGGCIIDLSRAAAEEIRALRAGIVRVKVEVLEKKKGKR